MIPRRGALRLWLLSAGAGLVVTSYALWPGFWGPPRVAGSLGVLLGLYVCAQPAANAIDALFFGRRTRSPEASAWKLAGWLALNLLTLLAGWLVLVAGAIRLAGAGS